MEWQYKNETFNPESLKGLEGFVYKITNNINGKAYIGKKSFWTRRKPKNANRRKTKESDWRFYFGSNENLKEDVKQLGPENFTREILYLCKNKKQMSFLEVKIQFVNEVLENPDQWYNSNISGKFFRKDVQELPKDK